LGGIFAAVSISKKNVAPIIRSALEKMLFRGSDCAGIATAFEGKLFIKKDRGSVKEVHAKLNLDDLPGYIGVGQTRFATHGRPHVDNAHPLTDCSGMLAIVGDGAVENYEELRDDVAYRGHNVVSRCDFEIVAHMLEDELRSRGSLIEAVRNVVKVLKGFYSFAVLDARKEIIVGYTSKQPLYLCLGEDLIVLSSTKSSLVDLCKKYVQIDGGEMAVLTTTGFDVLDAGTGKSIKKDMKSLDVPPDLADKDGYPHHMLREIYEVPYALLRTISTIQKKYLALAARLLTTARNVFIIADGTSLHAGFVASYYFAELANLSPIVVSAAEFPLYYVENVGPGTVVIAISQSGETGDVLRSVYEAKLRGATILGITNYIGSRLAQFSNLYLPIAAGPELAVPATKTFTSTLALLYMLALRCAQDLGKISGSEFVEKVEKLRSFADTLIEAIPSIDSKASEAAQAIAKCRSGYVISRGITYPIAMEGALKLKETAYMHAEGMEAGEFLHGPVVLVEPGFFTIFIIPVESVAAKATYPLIASSAEKGATVVTIGFYGDPALREVPGIVIEVPACERHLAPIATVVPLQLVAYRLGVLRGCPIDSPKYLRKAVT